MRIATVVVGLCLIVLVLEDGFETILLPRRVTRRFRYVRFFIRNGWRLWRTAVPWFPRGEKRETYLSIFGPLFLLGLFVTWVVGLIVGFALVHWSLMTASAAGQPSLATYLYMSGQTFFTLGYGDVTPSTSFGRFLSVAEAGLGFGFLAIIVSYLPVLYQAFSRRESTISLLDARAGSPPSAAEVLLRLARSGNIASTDTLLAGLERWCAELLESHLSFPVLGYFRSQHANQSWLAALAAILDTCALLIVKVKRNDTYQPQLTFAMARHVAVDLALVLRVRPKAPCEDRLPAEDLRRLEKMLEDAGVQLKEGPDVDTSLTELRGMYEPFVNALANLFLFALPPVVPTEPTADNWQRSAWMPKTPGIGSLPRLAGQDEHFR